MPDQAPNIDVKPGQGGKLVYDKATRSIVALRTPDASLARCPNTVRQSIADVIEVQQRQIESLRAELKWISEQRWNEDADLDDICTRADRAVGPSRCDRCKVEAENTILSGKQTVCWDCATELAYEDLRASGGIVGSP